MDLLIAAAGTDDQGSATGHISLKNLCPGLCHDQWVRVEKDGIFLQGFRRRIIPKVHQVIRPVGQLGGCKNLKFTFIRHPGMDIIHPPVHLIVHICQETEDRKELSPGKAFPVKAHQVRIKCLHLRQPAVVSVIIVQDPVPVDLRPEGGRPPPEEGYKVRPMGKTLHGPEP